MKDLIIPEFIFDQRLSGNAIIVLLFIWKSMNVGPFTISVPTLANGINMSETNIRNAMQELETNDLVTKKRVGKTGYEYTVISFVEGGENA